MKEVNELFAGWDEYPPVYLSVKAIVVGLGGGTKPTGIADPDFAVPADAMARMQSSALQEIKAKAGTRLPVMPGRDPGLPKAAPVFDPDELKRRSSDAVRRRLAMKVVQNVGE